MKQIQLNNGVSMPQLGYGVFQIDDLMQCEQGVSDALQTGYRLIDTAACYGNESAVGRAIAKSGVPREDIFISSKVWIQDAGYDKTMASFQKTLDNLQTDYLDLYLIHMPYGDYFGSWRAMIDLYQAGKIRAIGVCNFLPDRLADLIQSFEVVPAVNQIEIHPFSQRRELRALMAKYRITPMAWAPFAEGQNHLFTHLSSQQLGISTVRRRLRSLCGGYAKMTSLPSLNLFIWHVFVRILLWMTSACQMQIWRRLTNWTQITR